MSSLSTGRSIDEPIGPFNTARLPRVVLFDMRLVDFEFISILLALFSARE